MRDLPSSVLTAPDVQLGAYLELTDVNSVTYVHSQNEINAISQISWQIPFDGGMSKPANYSITLDVSCLDIVKDLRTKYLRAETRLTMMVGSAANTIQLHSGRVRAIDIGGDNPFQLKLTVLDKLFDDNPSFPVETLLDSYSNVHLEDLTLGYPIYYGRHHRPFYHVATDCDLGTLLGPRNVSSANHVNSVWYNSDFSKGRSTVDEHLILMNKDWAQQSGDTNLITGGEPFEVLDIGPLGTRFWEFDKHMGVTDSTSIFLRGVIVQQDHGTIKAEPPNVGIFSNSAQLQNLVSPVPSIPGPFAYISEAKFSSTIAGHAITSHYFNIGVDSGDGNITDNIGGGSGTTIGGTTDVSGFAASIAFGENRRVFFDVEIYKTPPQAFGTITNVVSLQLKASLASEAYHQYSIFSPVVSSADIAVSTNPIGIFDDIATNHLGVIYHQEQSSQTQVDVQSYEMQMFIAEQIPMVDIFDDLGMISGVSIWAADSGMLKIKSYQESATATNSINQTITICDMLPRTFQLAEAPLGTTVTGQDLYSSIRLNYDYDFQLKLYQKTTVADKNNNNLCNSMFNSGINKTLDINTKFITDPNVASYFLGNMVRKHSQSTDFVSFAGGPSLLNIELADVLKIQHPMITGSEGLYQVVKTKLDVIKGSVGITAAKLVEQG